MAWRARAGVWGGTLAALAALAVWRSVARGEADGEPQRPSCPPPACPLPVSPPPPLPGTVPPATVTPPDAALGPGIAPALGAAVGGRDGFATPNNIGDLLGAGRSVAFFINRAQ